MVVSLSEWGEVCSMAPIFFGKRSTATVPFVPDALLSFERFKLALESPFGHGFCVLVLLVCASQARVDPLFLLVLRTSPTLLLLLA
jgi:hypothetical protein